MLSDKDSTAKPSAYGELVHGKRQAFLSGKTRPLKFRREQLKRLLALVNENQDKFYEALEKDMKKPKTEVLTSEIGFLLRDIRHMLGNLNTWAKPTAAAKQITNLADRYLIHHDPYGVVLIISPWNYIHLNLSPLAGAIAAGNCAIIKPSEVSPHCEVLLAELIPQYMDPECYSVIVGGPNEITAILAEKFDYIFYTGSFGIGQIVHAAANKYLTPVTLELGGKSPTFVDDSVDYRKAAQRILWGKFTNVGQTCVAPDYILCSKTVEVKLIEEFKKVLHEFYGSNPHESKDLARIINARHWNRLRTLLKRSKGDIVIGGDMEEYDLWIAPTVIVNVEESDSLMEGEIFGPLFPIVTVNSTKEAIDFINGRDRPLAMYVYSTKSDVTKAFKENTHSGGLIINDCLYHCTVFEVPFGGVGESGMGRYHGKWSFDTFAYDRAVVQRSFEPFGNLHSLVPRYPPYTTTKFTYLKHGARHLDMFYLHFSSLIGPLIWLVLGIILGYCLLHFNILKF